MCVAPPLSPYCRFLLLFFLLHMIMYKKDATPLPQTISCSGNRDERRNSYWDLACFTSSSANSIKLERKYNIYYCTDSTTFLSPSISPLLKRRHLSGPEPRQLLPSLCRHVLELFTGLRLSVLRLQFNNQPSQ